MSATTSEDEAMTAPRGPEEVTSAIRVARAAGDLDALLSHIAADSRDQGKRVTHEYWRSKWEAMKARVPDLEVVVETTVESGEWVAHRYTVRGTRTGDLSSGPPAGSRFEVMGMDMVRVLDGLVVDHWMVAEPF